jgi:hypothetical protein
MPRLELTTEEKALRVYQAHLKASQKYNKENKEKLKDYYKQRYNNMKNNNPEQYAEYLANKKAYYEKKKLQKENDTVNVVVV